MYRPLLEMHVCCFFWKILALGLTVRGVEVACPDKATLTKVWLNLLSMRIKLPLSTVLEFNMEDDKPILQINKVCYALVSVFFSISNHQLNYMAESMILEYLPFFQSCLE